MLKDNFGLLEAIIKLYPKKSNEKFNETHSGLHIILLHFIQRILSNRNKLSSEAMALAASLIDIEKKRYILAKNIYINLSEG